MLQKTTIYLDRQELKALKTLAVKTPRGNTTQLIREAIRSYLHRSKQESSQKFPFLRKVLRKKSTKTSFGNPVAYQRSLRKEWS